MPDPSPTQADVYGSHESHLVAAHAARFCLFHSIACCAAGGDGDCGVHGLTGNSDREQPGR